MPQVKIALYGSVAIERGVCPECDETALIIKGHYACCDCPVDVKEAAALRYERMIESEYVRSTPSKWVRDGLLAKQDGRCFYCGSRFGDVVSNDLKIGTDDRVVTVEWDHVEPFHWMANNSYLNFVAACQICNRIKRGLYFGTREEAQEYVWRRRKKKGWTCASEFDPRHLMERSA